MHGVEGSAGERREHRERAAGGLFGKGCMEQGEHRRGVWCGEEHGKGLIEQWGCWGRAMWSTGKGTQDSCMGRGCTVQEGAQGKGCIVLGRAWERDVQSAGSSQIARGERDAEGVGEVEYAVKGAQGRGAHSARGAQRKGCKEQSEHGEGGTQRTQESCCSSGPNWDWKLKSELLLLLGLARCSMAPVETEQVKLQLLGGRGRHKNVTSGRRRKA